MKDFVGNKLNIGDEIVFIHHNGTSSNLHKGIITGFSTNDKYAFIQSDTCYDEKKNPDKIVKVTFLSKRKEDV